MRLSFSSEICSSHSRILFFPPSLPPSFLLPPAQDNKASPPAKPSQPAHGRPKNPRALLTPICPEKSKSGNHLPSPSPSLSLTHSLSLSSLPRFQSLALTVPSFFPSSRVPVSEEEALRPLFLFSSESSLPRALIRSANLRKFLVEVE